jgi:AP-1-like factor
MHFSPTDFYTDLLQRHDNKTPSHRIVTDAQTGGRLLAAGATWDLIIQHPLVKQGLVDVAAVSEKLKSQAKCDGQGPVFAERSIVDAIEKSVVSGSDELI